MDDMPSSPVIPGSTRHERTSDVPDLQAQQVDAIVHSLKVINGSVHAHSHRLEQQCGVSAAQLAAMWELYDKPGQKVTDLALMLSMHAPNCSNMVDKLRRKGLVRKQRSGPDQRVVRLYLTRQGSELLASAPRPEHGALRDALSRLPRSILLDLERSLYGLMGTIKA